MPKKFSNVFKPLTVAAVKVENGADTHRRISV